MTFYLRTPEGTVPVHLFQLYAESRLKFLIALIRNPGIGIEELLGQEALEIPRLDALIGGSIEDRLAHFALRSIAILDPNLLKFVQKGELELFQRRLWSCCSGKQLDSTVRQLLRHLRHFIPHLATLTHSPSNSSRHRLTLKGHVTFLETTSKVLLEIVKRRLPLCLNGLRTASKNICPAHGTRAVVTVPFTQVLPLLAKLEVTLKQGQAQLSCHQIPKYLALIFSKLLETSTDLMRGTDCLDRLENDPRLHEGFLTLSRICQSVGGCELVTTTREISFGAAVAAGHVITYDALQTIIPKFPPCMANTFRTLRRHHRLPHHSRVQLTLFLKSIFVPVEVTLRLLQEEYSKVHPPASSSSHKCEHSWIKDSRRYIYGTRHLYGLEGSRKNYSCHSCSEIQRSSSSEGCGGCPFTQSDSTLLGILSDDLGSESSAKEFMGEIGERKKMHVEPSPIESCHEYLWFKVRKGRSCSRKVRGSDANPSEIPENHKTNDNDDEVEEKQTKNILIFKPTDFYNTIKKLI